MQINNNIEINKNINYKIYYLHTNLIFRNFKFSTQQHNNST